MKNRSQEELLTEGVVLLHDNTRSHMSSVTLVKLAKFKRDQLEHPPYNPDMSSCDFHAFSEHGIVRFVNRWDRCAQACRAHFI